MKYSVTWSHTTLANLATIWTDADNRQAVTVAAAQLDQLLKRAPLEHGESREGDTRVLFCFPLGIEYDVDEERGLVQVNAVWKIKARNQ